MRLAIPTLLILMAALVPTSLFALEGRDYPSGMEYSSAWACHGQEKFNWYCEEAARPVKKPKEISTPEESVKTKEALAVEELEKIRKDLDAKRALAVVHPTAENIKSYMAAQKVEIDRASYFADIWRRVLWQNAELNFELKNPMNNSAIKVATRDRDARQNNTMADLAKEWGIFFFFRGDCPYCKHMVPTLQWITRQYDMTILPISLDGSTIDGLPPSVKDNGLSAKLGVDAVPLFVLGNVKTHKMVILGSGVLSLQDFVERIYVLTQTKPGDL
ncbi:MAG: conjugal transfer protein TraF [Gallionella sp.]|jgi:conjugal transfer pilus assembly protein TraF|nr:conjugal transfer protein TraF [Gallionella sp.]